MQNLRDTHTHAHTHTHSYFNSGGKTSRRPASCTREKPRCTPRVVRRCQHLSRTDSAPPRGDKKNAAFKQQRRVRNALHRRSMISPRYLSPRFALTQFPFPRLLHFPHPRTRYPPPPLVPGSPSSFAPTGVSCLSLAECREWIATDSTTSSVLSGNSRAPSEATIGLPVVAPVRYPVTRTNLCENFIPFPSSARTRSLPKSQLCDYHLYAHSYANEESKWINTESNGFETRREPSNFKMLKKIYIYRVLDKIGNLLRAVFLFFSLSLIDLRVEQNDNLGQKVMTLTCTPRVVYIIIFIYIIKNEILIISSF